MQKWNYLIIGAGWLLTMGYEWLFQPEQGMLFLTLGLLGAALCLGVFLWELRKERKNGPREIFSKGVYFAAGILVCVLFGFQIFKEGQSHILLLPLYVVLLLDVVFFGLYSWREEKKTNRELREQNTRGAGDVQSSQTINLPK